MSNEMNFFDEQVKKEEKTEEFVQGSRDTDKMDFFGMQKNIIDNAEAKEKPKTESKVVSTEAASKKDTAKESTADDLEKAKALFDRKATEQKVVMRKDEAEYDKGDSDDSLLESFNKMTKRDKEKTIEQPVEDSKPKENTEQPKKPAKSTKSTEEKVMMFRHSTPSKFNAVAARAKYHLLERRFKKGQTVIALDENQKPMFYLYKLGNELMVYKYVGTSLEVRIPAYVGNLPVRYVHSRMFTGDLDLMDKTGIRNLKDTIGGTGILDLNRNSIKQSVKGVNKVIFPETLVELPSRLFQYCYGIKEVVVPASVQHVSSWFLYLSGIRDIYFNGKCPEEFRQCVITHDTYVHLPKGNKEYNNDLR